MEELKAQIDRLSAAIAALTKSRGSSSIASVGSGQTVVWDNVASGTGEPEQFLQPDPTRWCFLCSHVGNQDCKIYTQNERKSSLLLAPSTILKIDFQRYGALTQLAWFFEPASIPDQMHVVSVLINNA